MRGLTRGSVSTRLIISTLLFSSLITLAATTLQLYLDYARDIELIHERMLQVRDSYVDSIAASLWALDREQLQVQVEGIRSLPDMQKVEVVADGKPFVSTGRIESARSIEHSFPLEWGYRGARIQLGTLTASASLDGIYWRLVDKVLLILGSQAVKTFLVSSFIFLLFQYLVTRHLVGMAAYARKLGLASLDAPLTLERRPASTPPDEIDDVVRAVNEMRVNLQRSVSELEAEHTRRIEAERLAGIGELSANIAHEIRNPLASIINGAALLGRDSMSSSRKTEVIVLLNTESQRLKRILDDFLRFTRQRVSRPEPNDLGQLIVHVCDVVRLGMDPSRAIEIGVDVDDNVGLALFDREQLEQVLWNLLLNATQAMPEGGHIMVTARRSGQRCTVEVADDGMGMSDALRERATEPFASGRKSGTGLGLSIVQRILADHGSELAITSESNKGTTVTFALQAVEA